MKHFAFILLVLFSAKSISAQVSDTSKTRLTFSVDAVQLCINELSLHVDYQFNKRSSFGINGGYIYPRRALQVNKLSGDQATYPGTVWYGYVTRANYKIYSKKDPRKYFEVQLMYKQLHFWHHGFENVESDEFYYFTRREKAWLGGIDFLFGKQKVKLTSNFDCEFFYGFGFRYRVRDGYTSYSTYNIPTFGPYHYEQFYPMGIIGVKIGVKIGVNAFFKRK